jgi:hypothetical protein
MGRSHTSDSDPGWSVSVTPASTVTPGTPFNHSLAASMQVMEHEIAWFETLDDATLERIASAAPIDSPEFDYANAELARRRFVRRHLPRQCGWSHG